MQNIKNQIKLLLSSYWNYEHFKPGQEDIITSVCRGQDTLAILATGSGKSLCYQIPGLYFDNLTLVITPLISLMRDQLKSLRDKNIPAQALYSGQSYREQDIILDNAVYGKTKFLFVSPERIQTILFKERLKKMDVGLIAVDEAHCISEWGHDFRPAYRKIQALKEQLQGVPIIALTATATNQVKTDIIQNLELKDVAKFIQSPVRTNISYLNYYSENKKETLVRIIKKYDNSQIVYVSTRKSTNELTKYLNASSIKSVAYHGGMEKKIKDKNADLWFNNQARVIVATKAFGMGIDKRDVRTVIHFQLPDSLEAYTQEAGRAGRDGKLSRALILYNNDDLNRHNEQVDNYFPDRKFISQVYGHLARYLKAAAGPIDDTSFPLNVDEFSKYSNLSKFKIYNSLFLLHKCELITLSDSFYNRSKLSLKESLVKIFISDPGRSEKMKAFVQLLLRSYEGLFISDINIDEQSLAKRFEAKEDQIREALRWFYKHDIANYQEQFEGHRVGFCGYRFKENDIQLDQNVYNNQKQRYTTGIKSVSGYILSTECRQVIISNYFGFEDENQCGLCDNCVTRSQDNNFEKELMHKLFSILSSKAFTLEELISQFEIDQHERLIDLIKNAESERLLKIEGDTITKI